MQKALRALLSTILFTCWIGHLYSQNLSHTSFAYALPKWILDDPFEQKVFIENNEGQFDGKNGTHGDKVLFATRLSGLDIYFSASGITYSYTQYPASDSDQAEPEKDEEHKPQPHLFFHSIKWVNPNPDVELIAQQEVSFYYTYPQSNHHTTIAHAFQKICYKNLYPGIDLLYSFPSDKKALEYAIIVHPGADLSLFKIAFKDVLHILKNAQGNIVTITPWGTFTELAPLKSYYQDSNDSSVSGSFSLNNNILSLSASYDHSKTLVIDPWTVTPTFSNYNAGYDVCYDLKGNVFAFGSFSPYQEIKVNGNGIIQWIYSIPNPDPQYADFAVDEATGISYDGSCTNPYIYKVDTMGIQTNSYWINNTMEELWRMAFNSCENQLILAGGGVGQTNQACTIDTGLTKLNAVNILSTVEAHHDMSLLTIDNDNSSVFIGTSATTYSALFANQVLRCMLPSLTPTQYFIPDGFNFQETLPDANYIDGVSGHTLAMNGATNSPNWLYLYDGANLRRYHKSTGALALTKAINPTPFTWGGIDVDLCDNLYLGVGDTIKTYDSSLNNTSNILAPNHIYDLHIAPNNTLIATGLKFIASFTIGTNPVTISFNPTNACHINDGKATAILNGCGNDSSTYSYKWSNGATTQTATGLRAGLYTVIISSGCDFNYTDTVRILSSIGNIALNASNSKPICLGASDTLTASGGSTYLWSNGATTSSIIVFPSATKTYSVQVSNGICTEDTAITVTIQASFKPTINAKDTICIGTPTTITATGGGTYLWNNGATTSSILVSPNGTTTYSVQVTNGTCVGDTDITITVGHPFLSTLGGKDTICIGKRDSLSASGGGTYLWSTGATTSSIGLSPNATTTYSVKISKDGCTLDTTFQIVVNLVKGALNGPFTTCLGDSLVLAASGGGTYLWSTGATSSSIVIHAFSDSAINVTVSAEGCKETLKTFINIIAPSLYACCDTIIMDGDSLVLSADGGISYDWSPSSGLNCLTCPNPIATPTITTTYTVTAKDSEGCEVSRIITIVVEPNCNELHNIPNVFTPNGDGINDLFVVHATYTAAYSISIYDRWGIAVYHSTDPSQYWDGTYNAKPVPAGVYYYIIKAICDNNDYVKVGYVQVIR